MSPLLLNTRIGRCRRFSLSVYLNFTSPSASFVAHICTFSSVVMFGTPTFARQTIAPRQFRPDNCAHDNCAPTIAPRRFRPNNFVLTIIIKYMKKEQQIILKIHKLINTSRKKVAKQNASEKYLLGKLCGLKR